jgi:CubicO group peptidase (beta-lactamase class C family)
MKKTTILLLLVCLPFLLGPVTAAAQTGDTAGDEAAIDNTIVSPNVAATGGALPAFTKELETLRQELNIPGWSAAILQDQELLWAQGFGYADIEQSIPATADTPYHLASVTKPIATTLLMQLVEEGALALDDPVADYGVDFMGPDVTVRHLLTHTSKGIPGAEHDYDGSRFSYLANVIEAATGDPFGHLLYERVIIPLNMTHTAANPSWQEAGIEGFLAALGARDLYRQIPGVYQEMARPYQFDGNYNNVPGSYPLDFSPAAGLISSVTDVARFDIALDQNALVRPETRAQMFTPARSNQGEPLIYGLGWYTQEFQDTPLIWHSGGWTPSASALLVKAPEHDLTFILLANSYNLTRPYQLGAGDVLYSTPALAFYKHFVFPAQFDKVVPAIDWSADRSALVAQLDAVTDPDVRAVLEHELWSTRMLYASTGRFSLANRLKQVHRQAFPEFRQSFQTVAANANGPAGPPQPIALLPETLMALGRGLLLWLSMTLASFLLLAGLLGRAYPLHGMLKAAWLVSAAIFGLFALLAFLLSDGRQEPPRKQIPVWLRAFAPTLFQAAAQTLLLALAMFAILRLDPEVDQAVLYILPIMFLGGWLLCRAVPGAILTCCGLVRSLLRTLPLAIATTLLATAGALPVLIVATGRLMHGVWPGSPIYWLGVVPAAIAAALLLYPLEILLVYKGWEIWPRESRSAYFSQPEVAPRPRPA